MEQIGLLIVEALSESNRIYSIVQEYAEWRARYPVSYRALSLMNHRLVRPIVEYLDLMIEEMIVDEDLRARLGLD